MFKRLTSAAVIALVLGACAAGPPPEPPPPPPLDPTGTFDITVEAQGMSINGVLVIRGSAAEGYTGSIDTDMGGAAVAAVTIEGQTLRFTIPEVQASVEVVFDGDEFSGGLGGAMGEGVMYGTRREGR